MSHRIDCQRISVNDVHPSGVGQSDFLQRRNASGVLLYHKHPASAFGQHASCESSRAWSNLKDVDIREVACSTCDPGGEIQVHDEILAERLFCPKTMFRQDLA